MTRIFQCILFICMSCIVLSCQTKNKKKDISFYHWKLDVKNDSTYNRLENFPIKKMYIHIMDVNISNNSPVPQAHLSITNDHPLLRENIVPVVFIHNQVISVSDTNKLKELAQNIIQSRSDFFKYHNITNDINELQIDCDWLKSHKDKYFLLLKYLKEIDSTMKLSVTLRLYPYKYPNIMGIPPVDYAVLMCYNLDEIKNIQTNNSIITSSKVKDYIEGTKEYPMPLIPALPIFGWWVWFQNDSYQNIFYLTDDFKNNKSIKKINHNQYTIITDTTIHGQYLRKGDILRNEFPTPEVLDESIQLLSQNIQFEEIILYHWDSKLIQQYEEFLRY